MLTNFEALKLVIQKCDHNLWLRIQIVLMGWSGIIISKLLQKMFLNFPELPSLLTFKLQQHDIEKSVLFINMLQIYGYLVQSRESELIHV